MSNNSLSARLYAIIQRKTLQASVSDSYETIETDAKTISIDLKYDRSNVSRSLNQMHRDGILIKIHGKPTLYLDKKALCEYHNISHIPLRFDNISQFRSELHALINSGLRPDFGLFDTLIGSMPNESLHDAVKTLQTAIVYPSRIHGYLLCGNSGIESEQFVDLILKSEQQLGNIKTCDARRIDFSFCSFSDIFKELSDTRSKLSGKSIVFQGIDHLDDKELSLLISFLRRMHSDRSGNPLSVYVLIASPHIAERINALHFYDPVSVQLPDIANRSTKEKFLFALRAFQDECDSINIPIKLNRNCLNSFVAAAFPGNLLQMRADISFVCRNAFSSAYPNRSILDVSLTDIPTRVFDSFDPNLTAITRDLKQLYNLVDVSTLTFYPNHPPEVFQRVFSLPLDKNGRFAIRFFPLTTKIATLSDLCAYDIEAARSSHLLPDENKIYQAIERIIKVGMPELFSGHGVQPQFRGLLFHLSGVVASLAAHSYEPSYHGEPPPMMDLHAREQANRLIQCIQNEFQINLPAEEIQYTEVYFSLINQAAEDTRVETLVICSWDSATDFYRSLCPSEASSHCHFYTLHEYTFGMELHHEICELIELVSTLQNKKGVVVISDRPLENDLVNQLHTVCSNQIFFSNYLCRSVLDLALQCSCDPSETVDTFKWQYLALFSASSNEIETSESHIEQVVKKLLKQSLLFLDTNKVFDSVSVVLRDIQQELAIPYNERLAVRFIFHTSFMIERSIKGEVLQYKKLANFISLHKSLFETVRHHFQLIQNSFVFRIPDAELAYITEIIMDYLPSTSDVDTHTAALEDKRTI